MGLLVLLLVIWLVLAVIGFTVKGLLWLALIAAVLFLLTGAWGFGRRPRQ